MPRFDVKLRNIVWDDEVDNEKVSTLGLPDYMILSVEADDEEDAHEHAVNRASDLTGFCIMSSSAETVYIPAIPEGVSS